MAHFTSFISSGKLSIITLNGRVKDRTDIISLFTHHLMPLVASLCKAASQSICVDAPFFVLTIGKTSIRVGGFTAASINQEVHDRDKSAQVTVAASK